MSEAIDGLREVLATSVGRAYFRRDPVAIVTVQGTEARLLVHPTTSIHFVLHRLSCLKVGGGTPLDLGLEMVRRTLPQWHDRYPVKDLVVLSDGRSTSPLSGPGMHRVITTIRRFTRNVTVVNPLANADPFARGLAERLGADYLAGKTRELDLL
jgi:Mg-chelatase subunit ChlD